MDRLDIDLDDKVIAELLAACIRLGREDNYKGCADCKLKFMCWTHKGKEYVQIEED